MSQSRSGGGGRGRKRGQAPTVRPFLPPELLQFLGRHSYSLLVKGEAATGKTILALSILRAVDTGNNYLYLSTRVSPSQLFENHPWLTDFAVSGTAGGGSRGGGDSGGGRGGEREKGGGGAGPSQLEPERVVDARLDEPVPFFERITNELMDA